MIIYIIGMICEMIDYKLLIHKRIILKYAVGSQGVDTKVIRFYKRVASGLSSP